MKRSQIVVLVVIAALGLMAWSGYRNYKRRKAEQQARTQISPPADLSNQTVSQDIAEDQGLPNLRGKKAPSFTLRNIEGKRVSLADYKGKAVLINFWATWCAPCKIEMPWMVDLQKEYGPKGFTVLGISEDDARDRGEIVKFKDKIGINYPILIGDDAVGKAYGGLEFLPTSYYVGRDGKIVEETAGLASRDIIENHIKKALSAGGE